MNFVNFRFLFLCFVSLFIGVYFSLEIAKVDIGYIIFAACLFLILTVYAIATKKVKSIVIATFVFFIGMFMGYNGYLNFYKEKIDYNAVYNVEATVLNFVHNENQTYCLLGDCKLQGEQVGYNINLYIYGDVNVDFGQKIGFSSKLKDVSLFNLGRLNTTAYNNNVRAICSVEPSQVSLGEINHSYITFIRSNLTDLFSKNLSPQFVDVFRAIVMGDSWGIDEDVSEAFSGGGITHLIAISGLNIMFLVTLLQALFNKLKVKKKYSFWIISIFLIFYCFVCGMSNSVVRACIMSICMMLSGLIGKKYDKLTSIGIAGLIILFIKPLAAFDLGFMLSFGAVLSIFFLNKPTTKIISKLRLPQPLTNAISVMLCAQLGIIPILALFYDTVNLFNLVSNLICAPLFEVAYIMIMIILFISLIMPFMGFLFAVPEMLITFVTVIALWIQKIPFLTISIKNFGAIFIASCVFCYFVFSEYVVASKLFKSAVCFGIMGLCFVAMGASRKFLFPDPIMVSCTMNTMQTNCHYVYTHNGRVFVAGKLDDDDNLKRFLERQYIDEIDYFIATSVYNTFDFPIKNIITCDIDAANALDDNYKTYYVEKNQKLEISDFLIEYIAFDTSLNYVHFKLPEHNYMIINKALNFDDVDKFKAIYEPCYELCGLREDCTNYILFFDMKLLSSVFDNSYQNWALYYRNEFYATIRSLN